MQVLIRFGKPGLNMEAYIPFIGGSTLVAPAFFMPICSGTAGQEVLAPGRRFVSAEKNGAWNERKSAV